MRFIWPTTPLPKCLKNFTRQSEVIRKAKMVKKFIVQWIPQRSSIKNWCSNYKQRNNKKVYQSSFWILLESWEQRIRTAQRQLDVFNFCWNIKKKEYWEWATFFPSELMLSQCEKRGEGTAIWFQLQKKKDIKSWNAEKKYKNCIVNRYTPVRIQYIKESVMEKVNNLFVLITSNGFAFFHLRDHREFEKWAHIFKTSIKIRNGVSMDTTLKMQNLAQKTSENIVKDRCDLFFLTT